MTHPFQSLLADSMSLSIENWTLDPSTQQTIVQVCSIQTPVRCPDCQVPTEKIHSRYRRRLVDLAFAGQAVCLEIQVRKYFCHNGDCSRRVFSERLSGIAAPWARRTSRLAEQQQYLALAVGGTLGAKLCQRLGQAASRNTLLRLIRRAPLPEVATPRVLGVDDWAKRKGQHYGTILVDLEKRQPIALLDDREAETLSQWLKDHPGVGIICRDRAGAYAEGASTGAPQAIQVADRFHLLQNLNASLISTFEPHAAAIKKATTSALETATSAVQSVTGTALIADALPTVKFNPKADQRWAQRGERHRHIGELAEQGWTHSAIAQVLRISSKTVARELQKAPPPTTRAPRRTLPGKLAPFRSYLLARWQAGCHNAAQLYRELNAQGFSGHRSIVASYVSGWRHAAGLAGTCPPASDPEVLTPRQAAWLVLRRPEQRDEDDDLRLQKLAQAHEQIALAIELAQQFIQIVRQRLADQLDGWLEQVADSGLSAFCRFAKGLRRDYAAVKAGVTLPWSSGPVEGQINRLKMLKRAMFGRAKMDLLARRFLLSG